MPAFLLNRFWAVYLTALRTSRTAPWCRGRRDEEQVAVGIDLHESRFDGHALCAHVAGIFCSGHGCGETSTNGTTVTEELVRTVGADEAREVVLLHDAGEASALRGARDVELVAIVEEIGHVDAVTNLKAGRVVETELANGAPRGAACLLEVAELGLREALLCLLTKAELTAL